VLDESGYTEIVARTVRRTLPVGWTTSGAGALMEEFENLQGFSSTHLAGDGPRMAARKSKRLSLMTLHSARAGIRQRVLPGGRKACFRASAHSDEQGRAGLRKSDASPSRADARPPPAKTLFRPPNRRIHGTGRHDPVALPHELPAHNVEITDPRAAPAGALRRLRPSRFDNVEILSAPLHHAGLATRPGQRARNQKRNDL